MTRFQIILPVTMLATFPIAFSFIINASGYQSESQFRSDARLLAYGSFHRDNFPTDDYDRIEARILHNSTKVNVVLYEDYIRPRDMKKISLTYLAGALEFTARTDPDGSLKYARELQDIIDDQLDDYDAANEKEVFLKGLSEESRGVVVRLAEKRKLLKVLIKKLEKDRPVA